MRRSLRPSVWLASATLAAAGAYRVARALRRDGVRDRASLARLRSTWTVVPAIAGRRSLLLHALAAEDGRAAHTPAVLVHGLGIGGTYLAPLAAALADDLSVFIPELPGHGRSDHDARALSLPELARALAAWMDARHLRAAVVVGHSSGCDVAAELALRRGDLVSGLVLVAPPGDRPRPSLPRQVARALEAVFFDRPGVFIRAARDYLRAGPRVVAAEARGLRVARLEEVLPRLAVPVRLVRGGRDGAVPEDWARDVADTGGAPPPDTLPGWGHAVAYDDPASVAALVLELARVRSLGPSSAPGA